MQGGGLHVELEMHNTGENECKVSCGIATGISLAAPTVRYVYVDSPYSICPLHKAGRVALHDVFLVNMDPRKFIVSRCTQPSSSHETHS
jgi:hypothetical protein